MTAVSYDYISPNLKNINFLHNTFVDCGQNLANHYEVEVVVVELVDCSFIVMFKHVTLCINRQIAGRQCVSYFYVWYSMFW